MSKGEWYLQSVYSRLSQTRLIPGVGVWHGNGPHHHHHHHHQEHNIEFTLRIMTDRPEQTDTDQTSQNFFNSNTSDY